MRHQPLVQLAPIVQPLVPLARAPHLDGSALSWRKLDPPWALALALALKQRQQMHPRGWELPHLHADAAWQRPLPSGLASAALARPQAAQVLQKKKMRLAWPT